MYKLLAYLVFGFAILGSSVHGHIFKLIKKYFSEVSFVHRRESPHFTHYFVNFNEHFYVDISNSVLKKRAKNFGELKTNIDI